MTAGRPVVPLAAGRPIHGLGKLGRWLGRGSQWQRNNLRRGCGRCRRGWSGRLAERGRGPRPEIRRPRSGSPALRAERRRGERTCHAARPYLMPARAPEGPVSSRCAPGSPCEALLSKSVHPGRHQEGGLGGAGRWRGSSGGGKPPTSGSGSGGRREEVHDRSG